jgi:hypothetical protein
MHNPAKNQEETGQQKNPLPIQDILEVSVVSSGIARDVMRATILWYAVNKCERPAIKKAHTM